MLKNQKFIAISMTVIVAIVSFAIYEYLHLEKAHSTFENYYAFRGCNKLLEKTDTYGTCETAQGRMIKIIMIDGKWYLEGDGPGVW